MDFSYSNSKVTHQGVWKIGNNIEIDCYVTNDKVRLLSLRATARAVGLIGGGSTAIIRNLKSLWIQPYLSDNLKIWVSWATNNKIELKSGIQGGSFFPFEATYLVDICKAYIEANNAGILTQDQSKIADRLLNIMTGFAKVGIISFIDEITAYQVTREQDAIEKIMRIYIAEEFLPWTKLFRDDYFIHICRLKGWTYSLKNERKLPKVVGKYTNELIYKQLPYGVLEALKNKTPKSKNGNNLIRYHQSLTLEQGLQHLLRHLDTVIALMNISDTWYEFIEVFDKNFAKHKQLRFKF